MKRYFCKPCDTHEIVKSTGIHATPKCPKCNKNMDKRAKYDNVN